MNGASQSLPWAILQVTFVEYDIAFWRDHEYRETNVVLRFDSIQLLGNDVTITNTVIVDNKHIGYRTDLAIGPQAVTE